MRIEELSLGDWVCAKLAKWESDDADTTPPLQVKCIDGLERHNLYVDLFDPTTNTIEPSAFVGDLIPIPLTPEILEKNGVHFVEDFGDGEYLFACPMFSVIWLKGRGEWKFCVPNAWLYLRSVHELQHALRLAGIEKEIEV